MQEPIAPKYSLFYDFHTHQEIPDVGASFSAERFTDEVKRCGVDYLTFHARCNVGMAYYDTKIGTRHPSLKYDLFGEIDKCCRRKGIRLSAYFNAGISMMEAVAHPDWRVINPDGSFITTPKGANPSALTMCYNSPYREHLMRMMEEVATHYHVAGFFIDCITPHPCICPSCCEKMRRQGYDCNAPDQIKAFAKESVMQFMRDIAALVHRLLPNPMLFFNGLAFDEADGLDSYLDCECLPTAGWGYEFLPTMVHYMKPLRPTAPLLNMTGRFYDWGDFGGIRTEESLKYDMFYGMLFGLRPNIGGHFHPRGDMDMPVFDRIRGIYAFLRQFDPYCIGAENPAVVAVVVSEEKDAPIAVHPAVKSVVRMLEELKVPFHLILADHRPRWEQYSLLIIPDGLPISEELQEQVRNHLARGGKVIACGQEAARKLGPELGIRFVRELDFDPCYFRMTDEAFQADIEDMPLSLYASACQVRADDKAAIGGWIVAPYFSKGWAGTHSLSYAPPNAMADMPFVVRTNNTVYVAGDCCLGYEKLAARHLRTLLGNAVKCLLPRPQIKVLSMPSYVRLVQGEKGRCRWLGLTAYIPEHRLGGYAVEEGLTVQNANIAIRLDGMNPKRVFMVGTKEKDLPFAVEDDYLCITVPCFTGCAMMVVEQD